MNRRPILLYLLLAGTLYAAQTETIVPPEDQVSEFDARRELASVLRKLGKIEAAENELRKLLQIRPKDPALLADLADLEASRGHFGRSRDLQLLELDRLHTLANQAIERREFSPKSGPFHAVYLLGRDGYWPCFRHRAAISPIRRRFVWNRQTQIRVSGDYWLESPGSAAQAGAAGATIGLRTVFNEYWRAFAEWTHNAEHF